MAEYTSILAGLGTRILPATSGKFWVRGEWLGMFRLHDFDLTAPDSGEVREVLIKGPAAVASYIVEPDEHHPANAWLYVCADSSYALEKLPHSMRKNVRRGLKEFKIELMSPEQFLLHGARPFCDSRLRVGLSDGTEKEFYRRFGGRARCPGHVIVGAWKDGTLASFLFITRVEDWVINEGPFGANTFLNDRPNDVLLFWELSHYMKERTCRGVSAGLSSIQLDAAERGLHVFKTKAGFEARPVHRAFVLHPILAPFANRLTLKLLRILLHIKHNNRLVRKATGTLASILGHDSVYQSIGQPSPLIDQRIPTIISK